MDFPRFFFFPMLSFHCVNQVRWLAALTAPPPPPSPPFPPPPLPLLPLGAVCEDFLNLVSLIWKINFCLSKMTAEYMNLFLDPIQTNQLENWDNLGNLKTDWIFDSKVLLLTFFFLVVIMVLWLYWGERVLIFYQYVLKYL